MAPVAFAAIASGTHFNFAHRKSQVDRLSRFSRDLHIIEKAGTWTALPTLLRFPESNVHEAVLLVCRRKRNKNEDEEKLECLRWMLRERFLDERGLILGGISAASSANVDALHMLLSASNGLDLDVNDIDSHHNTMLLAACSSCSDENNSTVARCVKFLLDRGADAECSRSRRHWTPLMAASKRGP